MYLCSIIAEYSNTTNHVFLLQNKSQSFSRHGMHNLNLFLTTECQNSTHTLINTTCKHQPEHDSENYTNAKMSFCEIIFLANLVPYVLCTCVSLNIMHKNKLLICKYMYIVHTCILQYVYHITCTYMSCTCRDTNMHIVYMYTSK